MPLGIRPTVDFAFKKIFGSPQNSAALIGLLNAILDFEHPVVAVEILNPFSYQGLSLKSRFQPWKSYPRRRRTNRCTTNAKKLNETTSGPSPVPEKKDEKKDGKKGNWQVRFSYCSSCSESHLRMIRSCFGKRSAYLQLSSKNCRSVSATATYSEQMKGVKPH
ncbi:hypothetical protein Rcae01_01162 [Novipirellula caenicola]|uniref:Uncharacterized protein n=1 Tax=Novipirellula caenicola TaxID=1536901 RepID=A0ABP9VM42_9BACT